MTDTTVLDPEQEELVADPFVLLQIRQQTADSYPAHLPDLSGRILECRYWTQVPTGEWVYAPYLPPMRKYIGVRETAANVIYGDTRELVYVPMPQLLSWNRGIQ